MKKEQTIVETLKEVGKKLWVAYHNSQEWKTQGEIRERLDWIIKQLEKDNFS